MAKLAGSSEVTHPDVISLGVWSTGLGEEAAVVVLDEDVVERELRGAVARGLLAEVDEG